MFGLILKVLIVLFVFYVWFHFNSTQIGNSVRTIIKSRSGADTNNNNNKWFQNNITQQTNGHKYAQSANNNQFLKVSYKLQSQHINNVVKTHKPKVFATS